MSSVVFPVLPGISFPVVRTPIFNTRIQTSVAGRETRVNLQAAPRYQYEISLEVLRSSTSFPELQKLQAFFLNRRGSFDTFLYDDVDDNSTTAQTIATTDGTSATFQLVRAYGEASTPKWVDVIYAPHVVTAIYLNGVAQSSWTYNLWSNTSPGLLNAPGGTPPTTGQTLSVDMTWYWPCRFLDDKLDFTKFMSGFYSVDKLSFISVI